MRKKKTIKGKEAINSRVGGLVKGWREKGKREVIKLYLIKNVSKIEKYYWPQKRID